MQKRQETLFHLMHPFLVQKLKIKRQQKILFKLDFLDNPHKWFSNFPSYWRCGDRRLLRRHASRSKIKVDTSSHTYRPSLCTKVVASIPMSNLFPSPTITPISNSFSPICAHTWNYSQGCNQWKCMIWLNVTGHYSLNGNRCNLLTEIVVYND
jgi:hypothetical protein